MCQCYLQNLNYGSTIIIDHQRFTGFIINVNEYVCLMSNAYHIFSQFSDIFLVALHLHLWMFDFINECVISDSRPLNNYC